MLSYPAPPQPRKSVPGCNLVGGAIVAVMFLGFMAFLVLLALPFLRLLVSPLLSFYEEGHCTITSAQVETIESEDSTDYRPQIAFLLHTPDGRNYQASGYDWLQLGLPDQDRTQAIVDKFAIGKTYTCWYNPWHPSCTILTQNIDWTATSSTSGFWIGGIAYSLFLCICLIIPISKFLGLFRRKRKYSFSIGEPQI